MAVRILLYKLLHENRMTISKLSEITGISRNTISELYHERSKMLRLDTIAKICTALECTPNDLIEIVKEEK